jgi:hypothetical protein
MVEIMILIPGFDIGSSQVDETRFTPFCGSFGKNDLLP